MKKKIFILTTLMAGNRKPRLHRRRLFRKLPRKRKPLSKRPRKRSRKQPRQQNPKTSWEIS